MRVIDLGGSPLSNFIEQIEATARRQGFVLINGDELINPEQFFAGLANDNVEAARTPECDCPPGFCQADETDDAFERLAQRFGNMMGQAQAIPADEAFKQSEIEEKREAVAQLGRIIEGLTVLAQLHAELVADVVEEI